MIGIGVGRGGDGRPRVVERDESTIATLEPGVLDREDLARERSGEREV